MKELEVMSIKGFGKNGIKYVFKLQGKGFSWKKLGSEYCLCSVVLADFSENGIWDDLKTYLESVKSFPDVRSILIDVTPGEQSPHLINHFFSCLYINETDKFPTVSNFIKLYADAIEKHGIACLDINDFFVVVRGRKILSVDMFPFENMLNEVTEKTSRFRIPENQSMIIYYQTSKKDDSKDREELDALNKLMERCELKGRLFWNYSYREDHYLCMLQTTPIR